MDSNLAKTVRQRIDAAAKSTGQSAPSAGSLRMKLWHFPYLQMRPQVGLRQAATGRPSSHPSVLLKLYVRGHLNRVQSKRRLEPEAGRNVEVMRLLDRPTPDHKTIADFESAKEMTAIIFLESRTAIHWPS